MERLKDFTYYLADLDAIPRLSREEETQVLYHLQLTHEGRLPAEVGIQAKHRLIEGNQRLVIFLAQKWRPSFRRLHLDDLIQEGNLALLDAAEHGHHLGETFSAYAAKAIRSRFLKVRSCDQPLSLSPSILRTLSEHGELSDNVLFHACSLDRPLGQSETNTLADTLIAPVCDMTPQASEETLALVETLLAGLTERQRQLLHLRYGLDPADAHEHTNIEMAQMLNLSEVNVCETLQRALNACRRLADRITQRAADPSQQPPIRKQGVPHRYVEPYNERMARKRHEQYEKLEAAFALLRTQGERITSHTLSAAAHVDSRVTREFLRTRRDMQVEEERQHVEERRLEEAYATLQAQGTPITMPVLCRMAQVSAGVAGAFIRKKAGNEQERLLAAYASLQAQGVKPIGKGRLGQAAQVSKSTAGQFLRTQHAAHQGQVVRV